MHALQPWRAQKYLTWHRVLCAELSTNARVPPLHCTWWAMHTVTPYRQRPESACAACLQQLKNLAQLGTVLLPG